MNMTPMYALTVIAMAGFSPRAVALNASSVAFGTKHCLARGGCDCDCSWASRSACHNNDDATCCYGCCCGPDYERLTKTCVKAQAITGALSVSSVADCEAKCNAQQGCNSLDTDGQRCYLKSHCEGDVGECSGWCGHRAKCDYYNMVSQRGQWTEISSSPASQHVTFQTGFERSHTVDDTVQWGTSVTASVSAGFEAFGASASVEVSGTISSSISRSYSSTFTQSSTKTVEYDFGAGVVWQWQWTLVDGCGKSIGGATDLALTPAAYAPPCCLPGYFSDITDPTGPCKDGPNLCPTPGITATSAAPPGAKALAYTKAPTGGEARIFV